MNNKDRYYTPEPWEIHVGQEVEVRIKGKFEPYGKLDNYDVFRLLVLMRDKHPVRIKLLDHNDIKALGWENTTAPAVFFHKKPFRIKRIGEVFEIRTQGKGLVLFSGNLRNKWELYRLMQQLGIKEDAT